MERNEENEEMNEKEDDSSLSVYDSDEEDFIKTNQSKLPQKSKPIKTRLKSKSKNQRVKTIRPYKVKSCKHLKDKRFCKECDGSRLCTAHGNSLFECKFEDCKKERLAKIKVFKKIITNI